jgi:hypothetical protein
VDAETETAKTPISGSEGKDTCGLKGIVFVEFHHTKEAGFCIPGRDDDGLLVIVDPPGDGFLSRKIRRNDEFRALQGFQKGGLHLISFGVVEKDCNPVKLLGENAE